MEDKLFEIYKNRIERLFEKSFERSMQAIKLRIKHLNACNQVNLLNDSQKNQLEWLTQKYEKNKHLMLFI